MKGDPPRGEVPGMERPGTFPKSTDATGADDAVTLPPSTDNVTASTAKATTTTDTIAATPLPWLRAVRRTKMPLPRKGLALALATYANKDGTNAHPGEARLAADCGINEQSVRRHLAALRDVGLIVRTFRASTTGKKNMADCYDLTIPAQGRNRRSPDTDHRSSVTGASGTNHRSSVTETTGHQLPPTYKRTPSKRSPTRSSITVRSVTGEAETMNDAATRTDQLAARLSSNARLSTPTEPDESIPLADVLTELAAVGSDRDNDRDVYAAARIAANGQPPNQRRDTA